MYRKQRKDQEAQKQQLDTWSLFIWDQNRLPRRIRTGLGRYVSLRQCSLPLSGSAGSGPGWPKRDHW